MAKSPEILQLAEFVISRYNFMKNTIFKYKAISVSSLLLCKMQLVPLVLVPSSLKIDANQTVSMSMDLYRCKSKKK
jgi:hypothetical protein